MDEFEIRARCLEAATNNRLEYGKSHTTIIREARAYFDYIVGKSDAEISAAVRALDKKSG